jgi:vancomycin permeability regulator SanA
LTNFFVVFGAAVKPNGEPSGTLSRRTIAAWNLLKEQGGGHLFLSGGQGRYGAPESHVMRDLLTQRGASQDQLIIDDLSLDTLDTVAACTHYMAEHSVSGKVYVCSSPYHNPRCWLLFKMFGVSTFIAPMPSDRPALGWRKWLFYYFRECAAIPWDILMAFVDKRRVNV